MDIVISHISALEYWRLVGQGGVRVPQKPSRAALPRTSSRVTVANGSESRILSRPVHCLCATKQKNPIESAVVLHHQRATLPSGAVRVISPCVGIVSPEVALMQVAMSVSFAELVGLMCEFCGSFSIADDAPHGMFPRAPLTSVRRIRWFADNVRGAAGAELFRTAASHVLDRSRSPAETAAALLLSLPRARGGYGLRGARLNQVVQLAPRAKRTAGIGRLEPDIIWPEKRVCVEYDSYDFHREEGRIANDARRKNALVHSDLRVITLTKLQLGSRMEMDKVAKQVSAGVGKRWRAPDYQKQIALRNDLLSAASVIRLSRELSRRMGQSFPSERTEDGRCVLAGSM